MALKDKLEQEQSMSELLNETKELNRLMTSYIRVQMNEDSAKDLTVQNQLEQIRENSNQIISNMESILKKQEQLVGKSKEALQEVLTNGQKQLQENNSQTIEKLSELEKSNQRKLSSMNEDMNRNMGNIESSTKNLVNDTKSEMKDLASSTRKSALISNWLDALKYGGTGAVLTSVILIMFYYVIV
ncbi:hypothetical protein ISX74_00005 [Vibrio parahaemolyticus]|nr:hypothetical protein [Vibrio parahaemolyticus]